MWSNKTRRACAYTKQKLQLRHSGLIPNHVIASDVSLSKLRYAIFDFTIVRQKFAIKFSSAPFSHWGVDRPAEDILSHF